MVNIIQEEDRQKLSQRPIESDTRILSTRYRRIDGIPFLIEAWSWEGIRGSTAVFLNELVAGMSDADLQRFLTERAGIDLEGGVTICRREKHTFLNFGFVAN
jgi:hypothetical protein